MCDSSSENESTDETLSYIRDGAASNANNPPGRSRKMYHKVYQDFMNWKISNNKQTFNEEAVLEYFVELSDKYKSSTLSTHYSILKNTLSQNHDVDISKYCTVTDLIKSKAKGYMGKKAKIFSPKEINKFLKRASDYDYLAAKVALIFGIVGGCRRHELYELQNKDVEILGSRILVNVRTSKSKVDRIFTLTGHYYELCKKYMNLRPDNCSCASFFIHYRAGKCIPQSLGINQFGKLGKTIAGFLGLPNPELYTGNCFKRTAATILVDGDGDILPIRKHFMYNTTHTETESCVNTMNSIRLKNKIEDINKTNTTIERAEELNCSSSLQVPNVRNSAFSMESSDEVWNPMRISYSNGNNDIVNMADASVIEDYFNNSRDGERAKKQSQNPLEDNITRNKIVNINIPSTSNNLQYDLSNLVRFDCCRIQNINVTNTNK